MYATYYILRLAFSGDLLPKKAGTWVGSLVQHEGNVFVALCKLCVLGGLKSQTGRY